MSHKYGIGECARCGLRFKVKDLIKDGQMKGLLVCHTCYDPLHPQEIAPTFRAERHEVPAPELSIPAGEGDAAPALTFDDMGKLI